jgi:ubiquinone biosynthesis protein UbiJ
MSNAPIAGSPGSSSGAARAPNPLLAMLGRTLEGVLNRALDLDPDTRARVAALDGRAVTIEFRGTPLAMRIAVTRDRLVIGPAFGETSALRIAATPGALLAMALARGGASAPGRVEIAGDADLARHLEQIATRFAPDIDEAFARVFGDVAGHRIARAMRDAFAGARKSARSLARDAAEFLTEESRDLVARAELDAFLDDVDSLRERGERLEARVRRLLQRAPAA